MQGRSSGPQADDPGWAMGNCVTHAMSEGHGQISHLFYIIPPLASLRSTLLVAWWHRSCWGKSALLTFSLHLSPSSLSSLPRYPLIDWLGRLSLSCLCSTDVTIVTCLALGGASLFPSPKRAAVAALRVMAHGRPRATRWRLAGVFDSRHLRDYLFSHPSTLLSPRWRDLIMRVVCPARARRKDVPFSSRSARCILRFLVILRVTRRGQFEAHGHRESDKG